MAWAILKGPRRALLTSPSTQAVAYCRLLPDCPQCLLAIIFNTSKPGPSDKSSATRSPGFRAANDTTHDVSCCACLARLTKAELIDNVLRDQEALPKAQQSACQILMVQCHAGTHQRKAGLFRTASCMLLKIPKRVKAGATICQHSRRILIGDCCHGEACHHEGSCRQTTIGIWECLRCGEVKE